MKIVAYPKIESATTLADKKLLVRFVGGAEKVYDCQSLLRQEPFSALENESLFRRVKVDAGGFGVSWSEEIDLSESELWLKGKTLF